MNLNQVTKLLKSEGLRVTRPRLSVAATMLSVADEFLSPEEIHKKITTSRKDSCDLVSVYRVLTKFEELGLVTKSSFHGEANRFKLSKNLKKDSHRHYFKCLECQFIEPIRDCLVVKKEKELMESGYKNLSHHLEITGVCPKCAV